MKNNDLRKNASGYFDPTAYEAIKNADKENERFHDLLHTLRYICNLSDFEITERIVLSDKKTGKVYR